MTAARPLAAAIRRKDWERAALLLLIGLMEAARNAPPGTIDDVLMLLSAEGDGRGEPQISQIAQIRGRRRRGARRAHAESPDEGSP